MRHVGATFSGWLKTLTRPLLITTYNTVYGFTVYGLRSTFTNTGWPWLNRLIIFTMDYVFHISILITPGTNKWRSSWPCRDWTRSASTCKAIRASTSGIGLQAASFLYFCREAEQKLISQRSGLSTFKYRVAMGSCIDCHRLHRQIA